MKHQIFNDHTKALFRMVYDETALDRNFYGRDHKENLLTIAWNRGADQNITVDNDVLVFPENTIHCLMGSETFQLEQPQHVVAWQFSREFYCVVDHDKEVSCAGFLFFGPPKKMFIQLAENDRRQVETILQMCQDEFENRDRIQGEMMQLLLKRLIIIVTRLAKQQYIDEEALPTDKFDIVRKYNFLVETHFKKEHQVKFYAEQLYKSPKTLSNLFALYNHKSPLLIIQDRLLMEAKRLLYYTDKSAKEIGYDLGFEDASHFSRFFKSRSGQSPTEFKKMNFTSG